MSEDPTPEPAPSRVLARRVPAGALALARTWAELDAAERHRLAAAAAGDRDPGRLFEVLSGHLALHGRAGAAVSSHTLRSYRQGVAELLEFANETGASVLRPPQDWGALFVRTLEGRSLSPATVRVRLAAGRALYAALRWSGATEADPFAGVRTASDPTEAWDKCPPYTEEDLAALLAVAGVRERVALLLGAHAGLRISEAAVLPWGAVDLAGKRLRVRRGKGRKDRDVNLSGSLAASLSELRASQGPQSDGQRILNLTVPGLRALLQRLARRAGVAWKGVHALRHAAGARLYAETNDLGTVADHLGHASLDTARRYAKRSSAVRSVVGNW
ncbi:MAG: hypothetical protein EYC70_15250 [Planctomycetota bacterium]|nr:MAG: hypothetical protein EYC70_15250 [Planctomycetota bacterium]